MQCTLNEVRVVKSRHSDDFDEINGRHTTYYKRCVSTCPICIRADDKCKMAPSASWGESGRFTKHFFQKTLSISQCDFNKNVYVKINPQSHSYMNRATCAS